MQDRTLLRIAFGLSVVGVAVLYVISANIEVTSGNIHALDTGSSVEMSGKVVRLTDTGSVTIIELQTTEKVVFFDTSDLSVGDYIKVIGQVEEYEGHKEVIAEIIRKT